MKPVRGEAFADSAVQLHVHFLRVRPEGADDEILAYPMRPEDAERIAMRRRRETRPARLSADREFRSYS